MPAQIGLVSVAVIETGRQGYLTFEVEEERQDFDDMACDGIPGEGR
jgi:hypothetical protein